MPKQKRPSKKRHKPLSLPLRQRVQKLVPQPTLMGRKRILDYLQDTIGMCEALFEEHGEACSCDVASRPTWWGHFGFSRWSWRSASTDQCPGTDRERR
jgi:hypothetical protein